MNKPELKLHVAVLAGLRIVYESQAFKYLRVFATNPWTGNVYRSKISQGQMFHANIHYMTPWEIKIYHRKKLVADFKLDYKGSDVALRFATEALGDTLAWVPIVMEWVKQKEPRNVYLYTKWNHIFDKSKYPSNIKWIDTPEELERMGLDIFFPVGIARDHTVALDSSLNHATPVSWKDCNMIDTQNYTFNLPLEERKPYLIPLRPDRLIKEKYVTICPASSQKIKHLLNPKTWMGLIEEVKRLGYTPIVVGNTPSYFPGVTDCTDGNIYQSMSLIRDAEFHIGLSSGLSWMAWAYEKPVLMIGNFTDPGYEFTDKLVRVIEDSEQARVFNNEDIPWEATFEYDPFQDNMQLARTITAEHVTIGLHKLLRLINIHKDNNWKGIYVPQNGTENPVVKLKPKIIPLPYINE